MSTQKQGEKQIRKITKVGKHSYSITIPIKLFRELGWKEKQKVIVRKSRGNKKKLVIEDWKE